MKRRVTGLIVAAFLAVFATPAFSQGNTTGLVVTSCGATTYKAGNPGPFTVDTNGHLCVGSVSIDGNLSVNTAPFPQFFDAFSSTLDTTTNWTANNSTGTAATSSGSLVISSSTTASAWGGVTSKQSWAPSGISLQVYGVWASFANKSILNTARVFGMFTVPGTPTTAVPATDGYLYRLDAAGSLFAEIWAAGVAISSTNITTVCPITNAVPNTYAIYYRTGLTQFYCGATLATTVYGFAPVNQTLPTSAFSIAGATPPLSSASMTLGGLTLVTWAPPAVKAAGQAATVNDPSGVIQISPNSAPLSTTTAPNGKTTTEAKVTVAVTNTYQQALASSATRAGCTIQYVAVAGSKGFVFFGAPPADTTTSFQLTNGQSINCTIGGAGVATDAVQVTATGTDIFVVSNQ